MNTSYSPLSVYSDDSPAFPHHLSDDEQFKVRSESEHETALEPTNWETIWGQWPASVQHKDAQGRRNSRGWVSQYPPRSGSVVSISSTGSNENRRRGLSGLPPRKPSSDVGRRGSDTSLLAFALTKGRVSSLGSSRSRMHRASQESYGRTSTMSYHSARSAISNNSSVYTDPEEAANVQRFRGLDQLARRFSDVVCIDEVGSSSSEEEIKWSPAQQRDSVWSPDTSSSDSEGEDEDEVHSPPSLPTPNIRPISPGVFSNFPLPTTATQSTGLETPASSVDFPQGALNFRSDRLLTTPDPQIEPQAFVRRMQAPSYLRQTTVAGPSANVLERPRPMFRRSVSSPLFSAHSFANFRRGDRPNTGRRLKARSPTTPSPEVVMERPTEVPEPIPNQVRKQSLAVAVNDFGFLASQITVEDDPPKENPRSRPTSLPLPIFNAHIHLMPSVITPHTPRFNPMDAFLGKDSPTPLAGRPHHLQGNSFFPPVSPASLISSHSGGSTSPRSTVSSTRGTDLPYAASARSVSLQTLVEAVAPKAPVNGLAIANAPALERLEGFSDRMTNPPRLVRQSTEPVPFKIARKAVPIPRPESLFESSVFLYPPQQDHRQQSREVLRHSEQGNPPSTDESTAYEHRQDRGHGQRKCRRCEEKRRIRAEQESATMSQMRRARHRSEGLPFARSNATDRYPSESLPSRHHKRVVSYDQAPTAAILSPPSCLSSPEVVTASLRPTPSKKISFISDPALVSSSRACWESIPAGPGAVHPDTLRAQSAAPTPQRPQRPGLLKSFSSLSARSDSTVRMKSPKSSKRDTGAAERSLPSVLFGSIWMSQNFSTSRPPTPPPPMTADSSGSDHTLVEIPQQYRDSTGKRRMFAKPMPYRRQEVREMIV